MKKLSSALSTVLLSLFAACVLAGTAIVSYTAPTAYTNGNSIASGTAISYNLYQGATGAETLAQSGITANSVTITTGLTVGSTVCWEVTAVIAGVESAKSNEACKLITAPVPGSPTTIIITFTP